MVVPLPSSKPYEVDTPLSMLTLLMPPLMITRRRRRHFRRYATPAEFSFSLFFFTLSALISDVTPLLPSFSPSYEADFRRHAVTAYFLLRRLFRRRQSPRRCRRCRCCLPLPPLIADIYAAFTRGLRRLPAISPRFTYIAIIFSR